MVINGINVEIPNNCKNYLQIKKNQDFTLFYKEKSKLWFECPNCGKEKHICYNSVKNGYTKSCGCKCYKKISFKWKPPVLLSTSEWIEIFKDIDCKPVNYLVLDGKSISSSLKTEFICSCGKIFIGKIGKITSKRKKSCGECNIIDNPESLTYQNHFQYTDSNVTPIKSNSGQKRLFKCKCGTEDYLEFSSVYDGSRKSCGRCNLLKYTNHIGKKIGKILILDVLEERKIRAGGIRAGKDDGLLLLCKCSCSNILKLSAHDVFSGKKKTCGYCLKIEKEKRLADRFPDSLENIESWFSDKSIFPLEKIKNMSSKTKFLCKLCDSIFYPHLSDIKRGKILSCGCLNNKISIPVIEILNFMKTNGTELETEYYIGDNMFLDLYSKSKNIGIEFNGLRYHIDSKIRESNKKLACVKHGITLITIFEDEWVLKQNIVKNILLEKFGMIKSVSLRPSFCDIRLISNTKEKIYLLDNYHIQGNRNSKINIAAYYKNEIIAVMSLDKPSRQNSGDFEISRMCSNTKYRIHGIWSKLLKFAINEKLISGKIYSFSDNRFSEGKVYEKIGFNLEKELKPDYYWTKNNVRNHKSKMRKNDEAKVLALSETQYWESKGWNKIWDMGKKKWSISIEF